MTEANEHEPLIEGAPSVPLIEGKSGKALVRVINPGWGSSGYYSPEVLERDAAKAFPSGTKMFWDHPGAAEAEDRPERSLNDLAGETTEAAHYMTAGPSGPGVYANTKVFSKYRDAVDEMKGHIGVSIRAMGSHVEGEAEGRTGPIIDALHPDAFNTVDFVTMAGRGGQVEAVFESYRPHTKPAAKEGKPVSDTTTAQDLVEARTALADKDRALDEAATVLETRTKERDDALDEASRLRVAIAVRDAKSVAAEAISNEDIPTISKERIVAQVVRDPKVDEAGALDVEATKEAALSAAKDEAVYLGEALGTGEVKGMGSEASGDTATADLTESFKRLGLSDDAAKSAAGGRSN